MFLGQSGDRVIFSIELKDKSRARSVSGYSAISSENEVIFPPNTLLEVNRRIFQPSFFEGHRKQSDRAKLR
jgi:hypothetical protein